MATDSLSHALTTYYIYALIDPRTETIFYVGQTVDLTARVYTHKSCGLNAGDKTQRIYKVIKEILKAGLEPIVVTLDTIETYHREIILRIEECYRIEMINQNEILANSWKTGRCVDTENPMAEAEYIKGYALATDQQIAELRESDKQRAMRLVFG